MQSRADEEFEKRPVNYYSDIGAYAHDKAVYREGFERAVELVWAEIQDTYPDALGLAGLSVRIRALAETKERETS